MRIIVLILRFVCYDLAFFARFLTWQIRRCGLSSDLLPIVRYWFYRQIRLPKLFWEIFAADGPAFTGTETCIAVIPSFKRQWNIEVIVRSLLKCSFISKVVVTNSNRAVRLADWVKINDPRVQLIDEPQQFPVGCRFVRAAEQKSSWYLSIDDDIFLAPKQLTRLFTGLVSNSSSPHGIAGAWFDESGPKTGPWPFRMTDLEPTDAEVDVLQNAYAFTSAQLTRYIALTAELGFRDPMDVGNCEDIILSFSGQSRSKIHDVGHIFFCYSNCHPGTAMWLTRPNFLAERVEIFRRLKSVIVFSLEN